MGSFSIFLSVACESMIILKKRSSILKRVAKGTWKEKFWAAGLPCFLNSQRAEVVMPLSDCQSCTG